MQYPLEERSLIIAPLLQENSGARFNANGVTFDIDLNEFSEELARLLRESLEEAGGSAGAGPEIRVQVDYVDFMFQGPCLLDYRVVLGDGEPFGLQSSGDSTNFAYACRAALEAAVSQVFDDERTVTFLGLQ